jgi:hypothetical protein
MLLQALRTVLKAIALLGSLIQVSAYFHVTPAHLPVGRQVHSSPRVYFASRKCFLQRGRISRRCVNLLFLSPPLFSSLFLSLFPSLSLSFPLFPEELHKLRRCGPLPENRNSRRSLAHGRALTLVVSGRSQHLRPSHFNVDKGGERQRR